MTAIVPASVETIVRMKEFSIIHEYLLLLSIFVTLHPGTRIDYSHVSKGVAGWRGISRACLYIADRAQVIVELASYPGFRDWKLLLNQPDWLSLPENFICPWSSCISDFSGWSEIVCKWMSRGNWTHSEINVFRLKFRI